LEHHIIVSPAKHRAKAKMEQHEEHGREPMNKWKYSATIKVTKPDPKTKKRDVYGEVTANGASDEDLVKSLEFALGELMKHLE
jgi:hypothetical protein